MKKSEQKHYKIFTKPSGLLPKSTGLSIAMIIAGFAEVLFLMFVLALDVLPFKFIAILILLMLAVDAFVVLLMNTESRHGTRRIAGLVIIFLILIVMLAGDYYVYNTYDTLQKISEQRDTWEYYDVITLKEGSYQKIGDISEETVYTINMDSKQLSEAEERLITKENIEVEKINGLMDLGQKLVSDENVKEDEKIVGAGETNEAEIAKAAEEAKEKNADKPKENAVENTDTSDSNLNDNIILVSNSGYQLIKSNIKGFKKNTQIIYKFKVRRRADDNSKAVDVTRDPFNVLISGLDSWGTIDEGGLSDVNMVMTVNPVTREVLLTSIPRDSYVPLHSYGEMDKLTHSGIYGEQETKQTIEDFLDIDINYTLRINFSMLVDVIDAMGGLDIYSHYDFHSAISAHKYHKGWQHLSGRGCLYFARERKAFTDGDMQRNKHQQVVLKAAIKKATNSKVILTRYTDILDAVEDEMATTLTDRDLRKLVKMQLSDMKKWNIEKVNIEGATGGAPCFSMGNQELSCVFPSDESVNKAKETIHEVMYPGDNSRTEDETE